jgi:hypothetical protein
MTLAAYTPQPHKFNRFNQNGLFGSHTLLKKGSFAASLRRIVLLGRSLTFRTRRMVKAPANLIAVKCKQIYRNG